MPNKIEIIIDGNNIKAVSAINGTETQLRKLDNKAKESSGFMGGMLDKFNSSNMLATLGIGGMITGLATLIKKQIDYADSISKTSQKLGISTETLSTLRYAAELADVPFDQLTSALGKFSKNLGDVSVGVGQTAVYGFNALGLSAVDTNGKVKNMSDLLPQVADKFAQMEDGTRKTWIAMTLFGKSGKDLIPLLNEGAGGIAKLQQEARNLGVELDSNTARRAEEFNDNLTRIKTEVQGVGISLMTELLPALNGIAQAFIDTDGKSQGLLTTTQLLAAGIKGIITFFGAIVSGAMVAGESIGLVGALLAKLLLQQYADIPAVFNKGIAQIKNTSLQAGKIFDALWGDNKTSVDNYIKKLREAQEQQNKNANLDKLKSQWEAVAKTLQNDINKNTLPPIIAKIIDINTKTEDLKTKFKGAFDPILVNNWTASLILAAAEIDKINSKPLTPTDKKPPEAWKPEPIDVSALQQPLLDKGLTGWQVFFDNITEYGQMAQQGTESIFSNMAGAMDNFYQASGQKSKEAFVLYKAFSIAQAAISTYESAVGAYKAMVGIPIIGPGLAVAAAAAATAFGLSNIARIASMQPGGGGVSGISASAPSLSNYTPNNTTNNNNQRTQNVTVYINGILASGANWDNVVRDSIIPAVNKAVGDNHQLYATEIKV